MADKKEAKKIGKAVDKVAEETKKPNAWNIGFNKTNNPDGLIQRTLIIFKPDAVQRGIVGEILQRFERVGLKIVTTITIMKRFPR